MDRRILIAHAAYAFKFSLNQKVICFTGSALLQINTYTHTHTHTHTHIHTHAHTCRDADTDTHTKQCSVGAIQESA